MKKSFSVIMVALVAMFITTSAMAVQSLRGADLEKMSADPADLKVVETKGGIERSYKLQPPMIPHQIDKEQIDLKTNTCMKCHSEKTYKEKKAPKAGDSHYVTRDGKVLETVSSRRYFCSQCHAPQVGADPLVQNNFQGAK